MCELLVVTDDDSALDVIQLLLPLLLANGVLVDDGTVASLVFPPLSMGCGALRRSAGSSASGAGANSKLAVSMVMLKLI
jgi:hypothetical protein